MSQSTEYQPSKTIRERVATGAVWLDQLWPGWHTRIDITRLTETPVLRQLGCAVYRSNGNPAVADHVADVGHAYSLLTSAEHASHGFAPSALYPVWEAEVELVDLAGAWAAEVRERRRVRLPEGRDAWVYREPVDRPGREVPAGAVLVDDTTVDEVFRRFVADTASGYRVVVR